MNPRYPTHFPPIWANAWGDDEYGLWAEFEIAEVVQRMRWIEPGRFLMGSPDNEPERWDNEGPQHWVQITDGFWLGDSACTQALWLAVMGGDNPSGFKDDPGNPVEQVNWDDVQLFLGRLQAGLPESSAPLLPSEAQWEYACRAGTVAPFNVGDNITPQQVNYNGDFPYAGAPKGEFRARTVKVKTLPANRWGLYEMHGNVWEWCADGMREFDPKPAAEVLRDPMGSTESASRALRGGSWFNDAGYVRSARRRAHVREFRSGGIGFRLALRS